MTNELLRLREWLQEAGITHVAMESTGVYWKPVFNLLEDHFEVILVNARHVKNVPGRKTDVQDSEWLCKLLRSGLVSGSFIPPRDIRELRDLTRHKRKLIQAVVAEKQKVEEGVGGCQYQAFVDRIGYLWGQWEENRRGVDQRGTGTRGDG